MASIIDIEGIGEVFTRKLQDAGIRTTGALLKQGASPRGRRELAARTGVSGTLILEWVNHADLYRIKGVAEEYSDLLEEAGVDTVVELARRNPDNLYKKMVEVNAAKDLVRRLPSRDRVADWVRQAKNLPRVMTY